MSTHDRREFGVWAAAARPRLRRTAYLLTGDWHLAEELAQETLVNLHASWPRVSRSGAPDAWARQTLIHQYLRPRRRPRNGPEPTPGDARAQNERDPLLAALAGLGATQRAIVVLRHWEDLSVNDVADLLKLSPATVRSQASRALLTLQNRVPMPSSSGMKHE